MPALERYKNFYRKYERHFLTVVFIGGFVFDNLTMTRVDRLIDNLVLSAYLLLAGISIVAFNSTRGFIVKRKNLHEALPAVTQFCFGALFSGFVVFYSRSGSLVGHLPFLVLLLVLFIGNEKIHKRYQELTFQIGIFFITTYLYSLLVIPVILKQIGLGTFILGGFVSLFITSVLILSVKKTAREIFEASRKIIVRVIILLYILVNVFYFTKMIPPLPLALKDIGVYHEVSHTATAYAVTGEKKSWNSFLFRETLHAIPNRPTYVFSSVFAPTELKTNILHEWFYYDTDKREWISTGLVTFPILGGRDGGYRGYSVKGNVMAGLWRVDVLTERGQLIGRIKFKVVESQILPKLIIETR